MREGKMTAEKKQEKEQTTIRLPEELIEGLKQEAEKRGYTITDLIIFILWNYVDESILQG